MSKLGSSWISILHLCLMAVLLLTFSNSVHAQSDDERFFWVNFGIGGGSVGEEGASVNLTANYQFRGNLLTMRITSCGELFGRSLNDYGIVYGRVLTPSTFLISLGGGLGIVDGEIRYGLLSWREPDKIEMTIGLPLEAQLFWKALRFLGLGIYGFANINPEESFYGCTLSLQIGKLR